jgi:hypothetical protein
MELFALLASAYRLPFFLPTLEHVPLREVAKRVSTSFSSPEAEHGHASHDSFSH